MKRAITFSAALGALLLLLMWAFAQPPAAPADLARFVPPGPLLYLEARNFGALLRDWNASQEKQAWLASDNFQVFSRSRLYLKLQQAQTEFAAAAGVPAGMDLLGNVAGGQSALAIYDIGALEFLYITRLPSDRFAGGALWKARGNYQPRQAAGLSYYVKTDTATHRTAAFATARDYVLLATREDVLAGALSRIAGQADAGVSSEPWFAKAASQAKAPGELRMVMNFEKLTRSPHFRSYWIQQNVTEMKQYSSGIADAARGAGELREDRVLIRGDEIAPSWNEGAVGEVVRFAPAGAGVYRAWASPSAAEAFDLLRRKILQPQPEAAAETKTAPVVALGEGITGNEADLETRIDEPPLVMATDPIGAEMRKLLDGTRLEAMLGVSSTRVQPDGVFVGVDSGVAMLAASDWNGPVLRDALAAAFSRALSSDQLGVRWVQRQAAGNPYFELDGLAPVAMAANGRVLLIANRRELLEAMLAGLAAKSGTGARYAAAYQHVKELPNFGKLTRLLDGPLAKDSGAQGTPEPAFFSGNLASLGQVLSRVDSESIQVHDTGALVTQSLVYRFK